MADYKLVDIEQLEAGLTATAEAIREHTGKEYLMKLEEMPAEIEGVFEAGKKSEYDAFWDIYQNYGKQTNYWKAFYNSIWNDDIYNPKYDFIAKTANDMFNSSNITDTKVAIDAKGANLAYSFGSSKIKIIRKIIVDDITRYTQTFMNCKELESIVIEGEIKADFNIDTSPLLNKSSITNIIDCLSVYSANLTVAFSLTAVNNAFETTEGAADGSTSEEWLALAATKSNWTISLV